MAYTVIDFKTKKALKQAVADGVRVECYQPGPFSDGGTIQSGTVYLEGPHYPRPHTWYAKATVEGGKVVKVT